MTQTQSYSKDLILVKKAAFVAKACLYAGLLYLGSRYNNTYLYLSVLLVNTLVSQVSFYFTRKIKGLEATQWDYFKLALRLNGVLYFGFLCGYLGYYLLGKWIYTVSGGALTYAPIVTGILLFLFGNKYVLYRLRKIPLSPEASPEIIEECRNLLIRKNNKFVPHFGTVNLNSFKIYNAVATQAGIFFTQNLIQDFTEQEFRAVLLHEVGHINLGHTGVKQILKHWVLSLVVFVVFVVALVAKFFVFNSSFSFSDVFALFVFMGLTTTFISRRREYGADAEAVRMGASPFALASALEKLDHLNGNPQIFKNRVLKFLSQGFSTHPSVENRVKRLMAVERIHKSPDQASVPAFV